MRELFWKYLIYPLIIIGLFITLGIGIFSQSFLAVSPGFLMDGILMNPLWRITFIAMPLAFLGHLIFRLDKDRDNIQVRNDGPSSKRWIKLGGLTFVGVGLLVASITMLYLIVTPNLTNSFWMNGFGLPLAASLGFFSWVILRVVLKYVLQHLRWKPSGNTLTALNVVKGLVFLACLHAMILSIATQFAVPGLGWMVGSPSDMDFMAYATVKIIEALGIGGLVDGSLWLNAFCIGIFATAGFIAFNIIKSWPKSTKKSQVAKLLLLTVPFMTFALLAWTGKFLPGAITSLFLPLALVLIMPLASYLMPRKPVGFPLRKRIVYEIGVFVLFSTTFLFVLLADVVPSYGWPSYFALIIGLGIAVTMSFRIYDQIQEARRGAAGPARLALGGDNDHHSTAQLDRSKVQLKDALYKNPDLANNQKQDSNNSNSSAPDQKDQQDPSTPLLPLVAVNSRSDPALPSSSYGSRGSNGRIDGPNFWLRDPRQSSRSESEEPPEGYICL